MNFCKKRSIVCLYQKCVEFVCIIGHRKMPRGMRYECIFPTDRFGAAHAPKQAVCPLASGAAAGVPCGGTSGRLPTVQWHADSSPWPCIGRLLLELLCAAAASWGLPSGACSAVVFCRAAAFGYTAPGDSGLLRQCRLAAMAADAVAAAALFSVSLFPAVRQKRGRRISGERCCRYRHRVCGSSIGHAIFGISDRIK